jgi:hypothetical protein
LAPVPPDNSSLRAILVRAQASLPPEGVLEQPEAERLAGRLADRLGRDLLPRLGAPEHPVLLVGIAGPNNVGKSSLFNALVGAELSPARAEGGLTRQCLAAAHPDAWTGTLRGFLQDRFEVRLVEGGAPATEAGPPGRLYLVLSPTVPSGLVLMDTPDFDSIFAGNRASAEALLVTVDLLLFVVSRQTYQNAVLVDFIREAVGHGRPWAAVYNEAPRAELAHEHLAKLTADVGHWPIARYFAAHQPGVDAGTAQLRTEPLEGPPLAELLADPVHASAIKTRALAAGLADAHRELEALAGLTLAAASEPERLRARLRQDLLAACRRAALKAVPADVLLDAFRDELDARSRLHRWVRAPFRAVTAGVTFVSRKVISQFRGPPSVPELPPVEVVLRDGVRAVVEALSTELPAWRGDAQTLALLRQTLGPPMLVRLEAPLELSQVAHARGDKEALYRFCRELVGSELGGGWREEALQAMATLVYSIPPGAALVGTAITGGFGQDAVVWVATALSTPLLEKFVDLLGENVRQRVAARWAQAHGQSLAAAVEAQLFAPLLERLDQKVAGAQHHAAELKASSAALAAQLPGGNTDAA